MRAGLQRLAAQSPEHQKQAADAEQIEWARGVFYDAIGDDTDRMLVALFGATLSVADVDAIEEWTTKLDQQWADRLEHAVGLLPKQAA